MNFLTKNRDKHTTGFLAKVETSYMGIKLDNNTFNYIGRKDFQWIEGVIYE